MANLPKHAQGDLFRKEPPPDDDKPERNIAEEMMDCYQFGTISAAEYLRRKAAGMPLRPVEMWPVAEEDYPGL